MATIDLPAVDSDVYVSVTAENVFGSGPFSDNAMDKISELAINVLCMYYEHTYSTYVRICIHFVHSMYARAVTDIQNNHISF